MTKQIRNRVQEIYIDDRTVEEVMEILKGVQEQYGNVIVNVDTVCDYGDWTSEVFIRYSAIETDEEYEARLARVEQSKLYKLRQYEALKKELGK